MATDVKLYIGLAPYHVKHTFSDAQKWAGVRSQIDKAAAAGHGTIVIDRKDGSTVTYVYTPFIPVSWVDQSS